jgi:hypothetical protein
MKALRVSRLMASEIIERMGLIYFRRSVGTRPGVISIEANVLF